MEPGDVRIEGCRGPNGEFGARGVVAVRGASAHDVWAFIGALCWNARSFPLLAASPGGGT